MATIELKDLAGKVLGDVELPAEWFDGEVNVAVMHQVVTAQLANGRRGSAKTRTRAQVRGGGRKPFRQKGTGRSRQGSIRSPQWVGGGVAHGRSGDENHSLRINKKMKRVALRSALTDRARGGNITVVRGFTFNSPKTKDAADALAALGHPQGEGGGRVLVVLGDLHIPTYRSLRNLPRVHILTVDQLNTYDVLRSDAVVLDETTLDLIGTGRRADSTASAATIARSDIGSVKADANNAGLDEEVSS